MKDLRGQDKTDEARQYRTEIPASDASDASNASKVQDYVRRKKDKTDRMLRRCKIIWKTRQNKTDETQQYRTMIPASDASNASEERDYWKTRQDKTDETQHTTSRRPRPGSTLCASLRNRNACGRFAKAILCKNLQVQCRRPRSRPTLCASLRSRNALRSKLKNPRQLDN